MGKYVISALLQAPAVAPAATSHFYSDWTFWQWIVASLALILPQLPPLITFLRPGRLQLDVPAKISITHKVGNPNVNLLANLRNVGGRGVRVRSIYLIFTRGKSEQFRIDAQQFEFPGSVSLLFVPFTLSPRELLTRSISFYSDLERETEKEFRANKSAMQKQIRERIAARSKDKENEYVAVDDELVAPFNALFIRQFRWHPGEYEMEVVVEVEPSSASLRKAYRFTLFESDTLELKEHVQEFKFGGAGITFVGEKTTTLSVPITEKT